MADNYLEKRMEELRSGRLSIKRSIPGIRPGGLRVVVAGGTAGIAHDEVIKFRKLGYRVAVFDSDEKAGKRMAYENGIRFHKVDLTDKDDLLKHMNLLLNTWHGIDMVVADSEICSILEIIISTWKESLPVPDKSDTEIVIINKVPQS